MAVLPPQGKAFNQTRQAYLATDLAIADTHWTRLRGLLGLKLAASGSPPAMAFILWVWGSRSMWSTSIAV